MKRFIFALLTLLVSIMCSEMYAQTFRVTDYELYRDVSRYERSKFDEALGTIVKLEEFDKSARLQLGDDSRGLVLDLQNDGSYRAEDSMRNQVIILTIEKIIGYYRSLKLQILENNQLKVTVIMKRE